MLRDREQPLGQLRHRRTVAVGLEPGPEGADPLDAGGVRHLVEEDERLHAELAGLVDLALARGGPDNISVIVIRALDPNRDVPTARLPMKREQGTTATE